MRGQTLPGELLRMRYLEGMREEDVIRALYIGRTTYYSKELEALSTVGIMRQRRGCWMRNDSCGDAEGWLSAAARGLLCCNGDDRPAAEGCCSSGQQDFQRPAQGPQRFLAAPQLAAEATGQWRKQGAEAGAVFWFFKAPQGRCGKKAKTQPCAT